MSLLPARGIFTSSTSPPTPYTAGDAKLDQNSMLAVLHELHGGGSPVEWTVNNGSIDLTDVAAGIPGYSGDDILPVSRLYIDTEADASLDDVFSIVTPDDWTAPLILSQMASGRILRFNDGRHLGTENRIFLNSGGGTYFKTNGRHHWLMLEPRDDGSWWELARSYGDDAHKSVSDGGNSTQRYTQYRDGRLIQGGRILTLTDDDLTVTFPIAYPNPDYELHCEVLPGSAFSGTPPVRLHQAFNRLAASFQISAWQLTGARSAVVIKWRTEGSDQ